MVESCFPPLCGRVSGSFAYKTISERLPHILAKVVDVCHKNISYLKDQHGEKGGDDGLSVVGKISKLRSRLMTDKPLEGFDDDHDDVLYWKDELNKYRTENDCEATWFSAPWLFVECYMYRYIFHCLITSKYMKDFDPFADQKTLALEQSLSVVRVLANYLHRALKSATNDTSAKKQFFFEFMQISLWANRSDLSLSGGENDSSVQPERQQALQHLHEFILVDDSDLVWSALLRARSKDKVRVDVVLDNSGFELCCDLILVDFLLSSRLADRVFLHPKLRPWFVSDVTTPDIRRTLDVLSRDADVATTRCAARWRDWLRDGSVVVADDAERARFWTLGCGFAQMARRAPELHRCLTQSDLIVFKGDLNYRKLVGDLAWPSTTEFGAALRGFEPAPLCALRTLKADVVAGLPDGVAASARQKDEDWMVTGKYAVIQHHSPSGAV